MLQLHQRAAEMPEGSYTTALMSAGIPKMAAKIREECDEAIEAAEQLESEQLKSGQLESRAAQDPPAEASTEHGTASDHLVYETCDVIYHLWVLLAHQGISIDQIRSELERREGTSGLVEKQNRGQK